MLELIKLILKLIMALLGLFKEKSLRSKLIDRSHRKQDEQRAFREALERKEYENASQKLRDTIDSINVLKRMSKKTSSSGSKSDKS